MKFFADKHTLNDLNMTGKYRAGSIFSLFNQVQTAGGEKLLQHVFNHPLTDGDEINKRSAIFSFFQQRGLKFPVTRAEFDEAENYLNRGTKSNRISTAISDLKSLIMGALVRDVRYEMMKDGLTVTLKVLNTFVSFYNNLAKQNTGGPYQDGINLVCNILNDKRLTCIWQENNAARLSFAKSSKYNYLLNNTLKAELEVFLQAIYQLDVNIAVGNVAAERNFNYAVALPGEKNIFQAEGLYHPVLSNAVSNTIRMDGSTNMMFVTGANMAGKSTLMKSFGIAVYLAHLGFPVAVSKMEFSVMDGIYSSINVPDDHKNGYSHFYAEVLRVKAAAQAVSSSKRMVIIFDELFKGTNIKDAYEATFCVTKAFADHHQCFFIISTHIIEVGEALRPNMPNISFGYMPTVMKGTKPVYTYQLKEGITSDRQGMIIIENEGILELLRS